MDGIVGIVGTAPSIILSPVLVLVFGPKQAVPMVGASLMIGTCGGKVVVNVCAPWFHRLLAAVMLCAGIALIRTALR